MVIQSRLEKHFGKGFDARPAGARGKRTPLPGKTFGEPKDDIDKQNEMIEKVGGTRISGIELIKKSFEKAMSDTDKYLHVRA